MTGEADLVAHLGGILLNPSIGRVGQDFALNEGGNTTVFQQRHLLVNELAADVSYFGPYADGIGMGTSDADSDAKAIVARIMNASAAEDIFGGPGQLLSSEDMIGKPFTLDDVEYRESDIEGAGPGVYALLHVTPWGQANGTLITCGARNVMAAAFRAKQLGLLPRGPVTLVEGKQTRKGFTPLWLQDMDRTIADDTQSVIDTGAKEADF